MCHGPGKAIGRNHFRQTLAANPRETVPAAGRNDLSAPGRRIVRGCSWDDRPQRARSAFRQSYWPYQPVYDVGFRVICEEVPVSASR